MNYLYDGDGRRAAKANSANPPVPYKLYWYGPGGAVLAETDGSGNTQNEYVFFGGKRVALLPSGNTAQFYAEDMLGSTRVVTGNTGVVCYDADSYPFGGERPVVGPTSGNTYKFTGKERDFESGLDNFGARYDSSSLGRFMSPDPTPESIRLDNPQTWNRYSYVLNNPLELVDPSGELWDISGAVYTWVDSCGSRHTCVNTIAVPTDSGTLTVYGSQGATDISTYSANSSGMVDMRDLSLNPSSQFEVADNQPHPEEYLNTQAAAGVFNTAEVYHEVFPNDAKVVTTAGSAANGKPAIGDDGKPLHQEHQGGKDADFRYMGANGKPIQGSTGASQGDVRRNGVLIHSFGKRTLTGNPAKYGTVRINNPALQAAHQNHMHARNIK